MVGNPECAGINRHVVGDERAPQERRNSEIHLGLEACRGHRAVASEAYKGAGLLSFEKPMEQDADCIPSGGRQHDSRVKREWLLGPA